MIGRGVNQHQSRSMNLEKTVNRKILSEKSKHKVSVPMQREIQSQCRGRFEVNIDQRVLSCSKIRGKREICKSFGIVSSLKARRSMESGKLKEWVEGVGGGRTKGLVLVGHDEIREVEDSVITWEIRRIHWIILCKSR